MHYQYGEFDGQPFADADSLFPSPKLTEMILQFGQQALDALEKMDEPDQKEFIDQLLEAGLLERDEAGGKLRLTPRMVRGLQHKSLLDIFENLQRGTREGHATLASGRSDERGDGTKPYQYGDPLNELDVTATLGSALARLDQVHAGLRPPIAIQGSDIQLHVTEGQSDVAMCILLDQSGSMMRYGRFYQAKRVALGMAELMRQRFPQDTVDYVGFSSLAQRISAQDLPLIMPKPVTVYDSQVRLRIPLAQAQEHPRRVPQHFTNLQLGLRLARQILQRRGAANKQIFIITDGQPTAHVEPAAAGPESAGGAEMLYLLYPPSDRTTNITLQEALRCEQQGIRIATFALIEDYWGMDWVGFIDKLTRLIRGVAYYCSGEDLASTVIQSYLSGKQRKKFVG